MEVDEQHAPGKPGNTIRQALLEPFPLFKLLAHLHQSPDVPVDDVRQLRVLSLERRPGRAERLKQRHQFYSYDREFAKGVPVNEKPGISPDPAGGSVIPVSRFSQTNLPFANLAL